MDHVYDFIIIGAGMIGSSTAKYVAKICSQKTEQMKIAIVGYNEKGFLWNKKCQSRQSND